MTVQETQVVTQPESLRESAQRNFMSALLDRRIRPGNLISQREIVKITGNSLPSVREALKLLEAEGVVTLIPKRGVAIRELSRKEIQDAYQLRALIEMEAIDAYVTSTTNEEIVGLRIATQELIDKSPTDPSDEQQLFQQRVALDHRLHRKIVGALNNEMMTAAHRNTETITLLARLSLPPHFHTSGPAFHEHLKLLTMIENRDVVGAQEALRAHLERARDRSVASASI